MQLGQYEVIRSLGKGSFGEVFLARTSTSTGFQKTVAIKRLRDAVADDTELIERFAIEARICGHLNHPNIIQVYNFIESTDGFLLVMEHLNGLELRQILSRFRKERRILPAAISVSLIRQLCEGLHFAHVACSEDGKPLGLVHRDIKPSNLMITAQSTLKIMDFGVARADFARTRSGIKSVKGTLQYMAPEQVVGGAIDASVDQYATGLILAEMLVGYPVYHADTENQLFFMVGTGAVEPVLELLREHHPVLHPIVQRALSLSPGARFSGLDEMSKALGEIEQFLPSALSPSAFFTALLAEELPVTELGVKPAWPLRQREVNKERERLNALARGLGMATPAPAAAEELGSSLTDHGLQLEPVSLHDEGSQNAEVTPQSLEQTFPTGVMPVALARLADPLAALREASSLHRAAPAASVMPQVSSALAPEEESDTEFIETPNRPGPPADLRASEGAERVQAHLPASAAVPTSAPQPGMGVGPTAPKAALENVLQAVPQDVPQGVARAVKSAPASSSSSTQPGLAIPRAASERASSWRAAALTALGVIVLGGAGLLLLWQDGATEAVSSVPPAQSPLAPTHARPGLEETTGGGAPPQAAHAVAPGVVQEDVQVSGTVRIRPPTPAGTAGEASHPQNGSAGVAPPAPAAREAGSPLALTQSPSVSVTAGPSKSAKLGPAQVPLHASPRPAGVSPGAPAAEKTRDAAVVNTSGADDRAPASVALSQAGRVILRVLPRGSTLRDVDSGTTLDCFWGCSLKPGEHTLQVVSPDGQQVSLPLEVPAGRTLQCSFQVGLDARWKCQ